MIPQINLIRSAIETNREDSEVTRNPPLHPISTDAPRWTRHWKTGSPAWWTWLALAALLLAGLAEVGGARAAALVLATLQALLYVLWHRSLSHFPTQVRVAYLLWMVLSFLPPMLPMFWIQALGTTSLVVFGYCPLARMLLFLPQNRSATMTLQRALRIIFHPPTNGSVLDDLRM